MVNESNSVIEIGDLSQCPLLPIQLARVTIGVEMVRMRVRYIRELNE